MNVWYESKSFLAGPVGSEPRTMPMGDAQIVVDSCGSNKGRGPEAAALGKRRKALPKLVQINGTLSDVKKYLCFL